jgi:zinc protease
VTRPVPSFTGVPELAPVRRPRKLDFAERRLASGLSALAVRRTGVPLAEVRLRIPFGSSTRSHPSRAAMLAECLLAGTAERSRVDLAEALQRIGASLAASVDADRLSVAGSGLVTRLPDLLGLLAEVLTGAAFPPPDVARERARLAERLTIARTQPGVVAREALEHRMWGDHPYTRDLAQPEAVRAVSAAQLRALHRDRVVAPGATLVVVASLSCEAALDHVEAALDGWTGPAGSAALPPLPPLTTRPVQLVDRGGSVQSALRLGGTALPRQHPDSPALVLANLIFGGNFSSRWVSNIREDKGYTYSPRSTISHHALGSIFIAAADVATEVTAAALMETTYELSRIATLPVTAEELAAAYHYATGSLALSISTQAGLAATLAQLAAVGLGPQYIADQPARLAAVTTEDVLRVAGDHLAPSHLVTVVVGDAASVAPGLRRLADLDLE